MKKTDQNNKKETKILINFPKTITIDLVPSNELKNYEKFQWLVIILAPIASGFWVAIFTGKEYSGYLLGSALVFTLISLFFIWLSWQQRKKMYDGSVQKKKDLKDFE